MYIISQIHFLLLLLAVAKLGPYMTCFSLKIFIVQYSLPSSDVQSWNFFGYLLFFILLAWSNHQFCLYCANLFYKYIIPDIITLQIHRIGLDITFSLILLNSHLLKTVSDANYVPQWVIWSIYFMYQSFLQWEISTKVDTVQFQLYVK